MVHLPSQAWCSHPRWNEAVQSGSVVDAVWLLCVLLICCRVCKFSTDLTWHVYLVVPIMLSLAHCHLTLMTSSPLLLPHSTHRSSHFWTSVQVKFGIALTSKANNPSSKWERMILKWDFNLCSSLHSSWCSLESNTKKTGLKSGAHVTVMVRLCVCVVTLQGTLSSSCDRFIWLNRLFFSYLRSIKWAQSNDIYRIVVGTVGDKKSLWKLINCHNCMSSITSKQTVQCPLLGFNESLQSQQASFSKHVSQILAGKNSEAVDTWS